MTSKFWTTAIIIVLVSSILIPLANAKDLTREEVKAELADLHALGYRSTTDDPHYPRHVQEMMAKLHEQRAKERSQAGEQIIPGQKSHNDRMPAAPAADSTMDQEKCVGPASFCNPYFGS
jgi:hypothetical protein